MKDENFNDEIVNWKIRLQKCWLWKEIKIRKGCKGKGRKWIIFWGEKESWTKFLGCN